MSLKTDITLPVEVKPELGAEEMDAKIKPCLLSCSVLKGELETLVRMGALDAKLAFFSMELHSDYGSLEKALRRKIEEKRAQGYELVVVNGDYCLGSDNEMKKLTEEYGVSKVDALNCIDCLFGGKGKYLEADPTQESLFLSPGWIEYFVHKKRSAEGKPHEEIIKNLFTGLKGIVLLDSLGNLNDYKKEIEKLQNFTHLPILERRNIGLENLRQVINEATRRQNTVGI